MSKHSYLAIPLWNTIQRAHQAGQNLSLFQIAAESGCDYALAHRLVMRFEKANQLRVIRHGPGRPLTLIPMEET